MKKKIKNIYALGGSESITSFISPQLNVIYVTHFLGAWAERHVIVVPARRHRRQQAAAGTAGARRRQRPLKVRRPLAANSQYL